MKKIAFKAFLLSSVVIVTSSCSLMLPDRSFIEQMEREGDAFYSPGKDFPVVGGDTGKIGRTREEIQDRTPSSERSRRMTAESASLDNELIERENSLSEEELDRYSADRKFLQTPSDKLYYLSLSPYDRSAYINTKKVDLKDDLEQKRDLLSKHSIHSSELYLGMAKSDVISVWGKPARIEIAGNPSNQNERWSFIEDGNVKQVYFEGGQVHGWALDL